MRKIFFVAMIFCLFAAGAHAQEQKEVKNTEMPEQDSLAPYQKYPKLPAFNIRMMDSVSIFNTYNIPEGDPIAIFFFSPDCGHCQRTTRRLIDSMEMLKDIRFYMITPVHSMTELRNFYAEYNMDKYENIKLVGRDYGFFFGSYYRIKFVPDLVLYDGHKKLIKLIQGETSAKEVYETLHSK